MKNLNHILLTMLAITIATSCTDENYDITQDIDTTISVGSPGLTITLGTTEKITLNDIIETDTDLKTDAENIYYLKKDGHTNIKFHINQVQYKIEETQLTPDKNLIQHLPENTTDIPAGTTTNIPNITATSNFTHTINNIPEEIITIKEITPKDNNHIKLSAQITSNLDIQIKHLHNLTLTLPEYITTGEIQGGHTQNQEIHFDNHDNIQNKTITIGTIQIKKLRPQTTITDKTRELILSGKTKINCDLSIESLSNIHIDNNSYINIKFTLTNGNKTITIKEITGIFDPEINPRKEKIQISDDLPNILKDDNIHINVANPTLKIQSDMTNIPISLKTTAQLTSIKDGQQTSTIEIPGKGREAIIRAGQKNTSYFSPLDKPYDPAGITPGSNIYQTDNIDQLITKLPDYITIDMQKGRIKTLKEEATIKLGHEYKFEAEYEAYIPFKFKEGLKIIYNDSINDISDDLKDIQANGATLKANVHNSIPLALTLHMTPCDKEGKQIKGIHISEAKIAAAGNNKTITPIQLDIQTDNPATIQKLDQLKIKIDSHSVASGSLRSDQTLYLENIKLELKGKITINLNK